MGIFLNIFHPVRDYNSKTLYNDDWNIIYLWRVFYTQGLRLKQMQLQPCTPNRYLDLQTSKVGPKTSYKNHYSQQIKFIIAGIYIPSRSIMIFKLPSIYINVFQELIYVWNGFALMGRNAKYLEPVLKNVEDALKHIEAHKGIR